MYKRQNLIQHQEIIKAKEKQKMVRVKIHKIMARMALMIIPIIQAEQNHKMDKLVRMVKEEILKIKNLLISKEETIKLHQAQKEAMIIQKMKMTKAQ